MPDVPDLRNGIHQLVSGYNTDCFTPAELVKQLYQRLRSLNDPGIFLHLLEEDAVTEAARKLGEVPLTARGPLFGIPFAVKDNIDVASLPTTAACPAFSYVAKENAAAVDAIIRAGGLLIGKTNLDQFATGLVGLRTPYPVPKNVYNPDYVPGGSSSGSAVAVARGLVSFALGTDTAGSGRVPAAMNGIVGYKPTGGVVSTRGVVPACRALDCVSVFASSVADCALVLSVMQGYDAADPYSVQEAGSVAFAPGVVPPGVRCGVPEASQLVFTDEHSRHNFDQVLRGLIASGAQVKRFDLRPFLEVARMLYAGPWVGQRLEAAGALLEREPEALLDVIREILTGAKQFTALDAYRGEARLRILAREAQRVWRDVDVLVLPSVPGPLKIEAVRKDPIGPNAIFGTYTNFVNLLGLCGVAVPSGMAEDGMPRGVTVIAQGQQDALAAGVAQRIHASVTDAGRHAVGLHPSGEFERGQIGTVTERAPPAAIYSSASNLPVVVFGAHIRGQPLNGELIQLAAEFNGRVGTAPRYRMYALDTQPLKPGLVRVGPGETGASIEGERWLLSAEGLGRLTSALKAPMCLGVVELEDGTRATGFLCEPTAIVGARDITQYGSWRRFLNVGG